MEFWRTKQFKLLNKEWDSKLSDIGFSDIEVEIKGDRQLKQKATNSYRQATSLERETRLEYYCRLSGLACNESFPNELEKIVMVKHSEGVSIKEILEELKSHGYIRNRLTIRYIIRRWQTKWGIRHWTPRQMNLKIITRHKMAK